MSGPLYCPACKAMVPLIKEHGVKGLGLAVGGTLAVNARTFWGKLLATLIPVIVGHFVDEEVSSVCGACGRRTVRMA